MKDINSKLKIHMNNVNVMNNNMENIMLRFILGSFGVLALVYVFVLCNMVSNIVVRKSMEAEARILSNEVGALELSYLSMSSNIDLNLASSMGFKESKITFATRKAIGFLPSSINVTESDL
jgi:hypothetical protein